MWICEVMKGDEQKRNTFAIASHNGNYPLHSFVVGVHFLEFLPLVIKMFPHALVRKDQRGETPLDYAKKWTQALLTDTGRTNHAAFIRCIEENTANYPNLLNQVTVKCSMVELKRRGVTAVVSSLRINDLSPPQFVFKVIEELSNREMKPLVEELLNIYIESRKTETESFYFLLLVLLRQKKTLDFHLPC